MGFRVEVHKLVDSSTKRRSASVDIETGETKVIEKQARLLMRYARKR